MSLIPKGLFGGLLKLLYPKVNNVPPSDPVVEKVCDDVDNAISKLGAPSVCSRLHTDPVADKIHDVILGKADVEPDVSSISKGFTAHWPTFDTEDALAHAHAVDAIDHQQDHTIPIDDIAEPNITISYELFHDPDATISAAIKCAESLRLDLIRRVPPDKMDGLITDLPNASDVADYPSGLSDNFNQEWVRRLLKYHLDDNIDIVYDMKFLHHLVWKCSDIKIPIPGLEIDYDGNVAYPKKWGEPIPGLGADFDGFVEPSFQYGPTFLQKRYVEELMSGVELDSSLCSTESSVSFEESWLAAHSLDSVMIPEILEPINRHHHKRYQPTPIPISIIGDNMHRPIDSDTSTMYLDRGPDPTEDYRSPTSINDNRRTGLWFSTTKPANNKRVARSRKNNKIARVSRRANRK